MSEQVPDSRAQIVPLPAATPRPLWSVMIPTYNCARYLHDTLESVLVQDPGPSAMQIEVVDDASDDDPEQVVATVGRGRVGFYRQSRNRGQTGNFATCIERASGHIVHLLHGDDQVLQGFYARLGSAFVQDSDIGAAFCRWQMIDHDGAEIEVANEEQAEPGRLHDALARLASEQRITTPAIAVRRSVYERLGGFDSRLKCSEDWEMWVRIAAHYSIWYEPDLLASYRVHGTSTTAKHLRNAEELRYTAMAIAMIRPLLPAGRAREIVRAARSAYAGTALGHAARYRSAGDRAAALAHLRAALRFSWRPRVLRRVLAIGMLGEGHDR